MSAADLLEMFTRFLLFSLMAIGGGITVVPEMHRLMVDQHRWLSDAQFSASIALAQASPGPNILLVTVMGWNAGGWAGALATTVGMLLPSTTIALMANRGAERWRAHRFVRAFREGTVPLTIGLLFAAGWGAGGADRPSPGGGGAHGGDGLAGLAHQGQSAVADRRRGGGRRRRAALRPAERHHRQPVGQPP